MKKVNMSSISNKIKFIYGDECEKNTVGMIIFSNGTDYFFDAEYKNKMSNEEVEALLLRGAAIFKDGKYYKPTSFDDENVSFGENSNGESINIDEITSKLRNNELKDLKLSTSAISNNKIDDSFIIGTKYSGTFSFDVTNPNDIKIGNTYTLNIYFTDDTKMQITNAVWRFIYSDGSESSGTISVGSYRIAEKEVKSIYVQMVADHSTMYGGKIYKGILLNEGMRELTYDKYTVEYNSDALSEIYNDIENINNASLSKDILFTQTDNLFDIDNITPNKQLQPYNVIDDDTMIVTNYIPIENGESLFVYPSIGGSQVANLYDENKAKIGWVTLSTTANIENTINKENVKFIRFNIPKVYLKDSFIVSKSKILIPNANKEVIKTELLNMNNTNVNWWYGKKGDSLGDSLTGQGFFQRYVSMYYNLHSFKNNGVGGSKLSGENVDDTRPSMWQDSRIESLRNDADFVTILGGQNDGDVEIGNVSKSNTDTNTYVGALNTIIDKIYTKYNGNITIILCTPFYVPSEGDDGERFIALDKAVIEVGRLHGLPVADFGGLSGSNKYVKDIYWDSTDYTHPLEKFYSERIAPILIDTMNKIKPIDFDSVNSISYNIIQ